MRFRVLGPVRFEPRTPSAAKQRAVLAVLLLRAGSVVSASALFDELWPQGPPRTAATTLQVYVSHLREAIAEGGDAPLVTRAPGYLLRVGAGEFDVRWFEELHRDGRGAARRGDFAAVSRTLGEALALWQGPGRVGGGARAADDGAHDEQQGPVPVEPARPAGQRAVRVRQFQARSMPDRVPRQRSNTGTAACWARRRGSSYGYGKRASV
ncbi:AfsR/SARP family transcriptional regulator [Streptomyces blattellae]|uniref:AfsR/SARP family transcriptional regulator n=1 Tax=Streptomyces blattellae TaxID=2569855 RepID=UPI001E3F2A48|nr:winged helix-turn-helix domain-containing protein [Streptomyces blattellae]